MRIEKNEQQTKDFIIKHINDSLMMLNDVNSFIFLRSKNGISFLKQHKLGGGNLLSVIGQFAILNFLAKIHYVLKRGKEVYVAPDKRESILKIKQTANPRFKKYIRVPLLGEINEMDAFVLLVLNYPEDLGIPRQKQKIEKLWKNIRNKISHLATLGEDHISMTFEYISLEFPESVERPKKEKWIIKPFAVYEPHQREELREKIMKDTPELKNPVLEIQFHNLYKDIVHIDLLNSAVKDIADWMISEINSKYKEKYLLDTKEWLELQFAST